MNLNRSNPVMTMDTGGVMSAIHSSKASQLRILFVSIRHRQLYH
jgi:hypothetical protein